jgi:hypothetical protein
MGRWSTFDSEGIADESVQQTRGCPARSIRLLTAENVQFDFSYSNNISRVFSSCFELLTLFLSLRYGLQSRDPNTLCSSEIPGLPWPYLITNLVKLTRRSVWPQLFGTDIVSVRRRRRMTSANPIAKLAYDYFNVCAANQRRGRACRSRQLQSYMFEASNPSR